MARVKKWSSPDGTQSGYNFQCPGCGYSHSVNQTWAFSGDLDRPTFSPSVLVTSGHFCAHHKPGDDCWCTFYADPENADVTDRRFQCGVCHSFVRDGRIQFLGDCTHELAGQTVDLPEWTLD